MLVNKAVSVRHDSADFILLYKYELIYMYVCVYEYVHIMCQRLSLRPINNICRLTKTSNRGNKSGTSKMQSSTQCCHRGKTEQNWREKGKGCLQSLTIIFNCVAKIISINGRLSNSVSLDIFFILNIKLGKSRIFRGIITQSWLFTLIVCIHGLLPRDYRSPWNITPGFLTISSYDERESIWLPKMSIVLFLCIRFLARQAE